MSTLSRRMMRPWLMFVGPDAGGGGGDDSSLTPEQFREKYGYPSGTKTDDMTDAEQAAYWRRKSKGFQKDSESKDRELSQWKGLGEFDAVSTTVGTAEQARLAALSDAERAREEAQRAEQAARAAGEATGQQKYLGEAIAGQLVALTIKPGEKPEDALNRVKGALQFTDPTRFLNADKDIDPALVAQFAASVAPSAGEGNGEGGDVLATLYGRQSTTPPAATSIAEARKQTRERLGKKTK
ncbi:hypothetical protein [Microbacterium trichothecenolyticum]|uniref:Scaffolding protein n=1 Tax=Microbacterium trichothecenolyticum TaxID=69370 RepID=A0A0M2H0L0_MICTR|nr:hypothetical protein [Microbacterium trichothecenolyticum]KJL39916.1 hypothetical protein RS82_04129 [Microbacterium trichothecenolyticum]